MLPEKTTTFNDTDAYFPDQGLNFSTFASDVKHSPNNRLSLIVYWTCALLGVFSLALNVFVIQVLVFNKRKTFKNVFYLLVLHCSLVDWFQALALVAWCVPPLNLFSFNTTIILRKWPPIFLRTLNMVTISNLLLFTFNEYIVVSRPIFYRSHDLRRMFGLLLLLSWLACIFFGGGGLMYKYFESQPKFNVYVLFKKDDKNATYIIPKKRLLDSRDILVAEGNSDDLLQRTFLLIALIASIVCLFIVLGCYASLIHKIRRFNKEDECPVADGGDSPRRPFRQASSVTMDSDSSFNFRLAKISVQAGSLKRVRDRNNRGTRRNRRRKTSTNILRHKYILVVGSILFINILFIVPYSIIQILQLQYSKSHSSLANAYKWARQKWILQAMIGLHSVLKPLCYFRMQEFRKWAKCKK